MQVLVKIVVVLIVTMMSTVLSAQNNYSITVKIEDADSDEGQMFVALYDAEGDFLSKTYKTAKTDIINQQCRITFIDVPEGTYAISIFHDENNNGKLDKNYFGIPKEDYGCSNNATGFMGPPKWKDAKFSLNKDESIIIKL